MNNGAQLSHSQSDLPDIGTNVKAYHPGLYDLLQQTVDARLIFPKRQNTTIYVGMRGQIQL